MSTHTVLFNPSSAGPEDNNNATFSLLADTRYGIKDPLTTYNEPQKPKEPYPTNLSGWIDVLNNSIDVCIAVRKALDAYEKALRTDEHPDLTPNFKAEETERLNVLKSTLKLTINSMTLTIFDLRDLLGKETENFPAGFKEFEDSIVPEKIAQRCEDDVRYVNKARAYVISTHVFYKVNYALCPVAKG